MSEVAITLGAITLAEKLVELLCARKEAIEQSAVAKGDQERADCQNRMVLAHQAALAVHRQLQAALARFPVPAVEIPVTLGAGNVLTVGTPTTPTTQPKGCTTNNGGGA